MMLPLSALKPTILETRGPSDHNLTLLRPWVQTDLSSHKVVFQGFSQQQNLSDTGHLQQSYKHITTFQDLEQEK